MNTSADVQTIKKPSPDFPFESKFVNVNGYKIHYVEEGQGDPVLFVHGNPTWSYVWRNIMPAVAHETGRRSIALDLLGFGKSDKPGIEYSVTLHYYVLEKFIEQLGLKNIIVVLHDWGGPLGMYYAVHHPDTIRGIVLMETFLWNMCWEDFGKRKGLIFRILRSPAGYFVNQIMNFFVNEFIPAGVLHKENLSNEIMHHYRHPFPSVVSRKAVRAFPQVLPIEGRPDESCEFIERIEQKLPAVKSPVLWIRARPGMIITEDTAYHLIALKERLPRLVVKEFGQGLHFLQEDDPDKVARIIVSWMRENKLGATSVLKDVA